MSLNAAEHPEASRNQKPATENPWYVLATVCGEQVGETTDNELHARNRRLWNGWSGSHLSADQLEKFVVSLRLDPRDFAPWTAEEKGLVDFHFRTRNLTIPNSQDPIEFEDTNFSNPTNFSKFTFFSHTSFSNSHFLGSASFLDSNLVKGLHFRSAFCKGRADFGFVKCGGIADFRGSKFSGFTILANGLFSGPVFFGSVDFLANLFAHNATFGKPCEFVYAHFFGEAVFDAAQFHQDALFLACQFDGVTKFVGSRFHGHLKLTDAIFSKPANFRSALFEKRFPEFSCTILHASAKFSAKDEFWPRTTDAPAEESREALAIIRHVVGKQGLPEEEHYFFRREMAFAARIGSPLQRFPYWAFGVVSDYGNSLAKPVIGLGLVGYVGLVVYWNWLAWYAPDNLDFAGPFRTAAGFSVAQLFGFLGFTGSYFRDLLDALPWQLKVIGGFQTVAGVVLLFFLGLGLRNRFRLK